MAVLDAINFPPQFSTDGTTYKDLICVKDWTLTGSNSVNQEETFCAVYSAIGNPSFSGSANAIADTAPTSGSQVSYEDVLGWFVNKTAIYFRVQSPTSGTPGTDFYTQFACYITSLEQTFTYGNKVGFSIGWESNGTIDITA